MAKRRTQQKPEVKSNKQGQNINQRKKDFKHVEKLELKAKQKAEREKKITESKAKRLEKTKIIQKKTKRGQPLMKDRIQFLLRKIETMKK